ncbi:Spaf_1101 family AAA-like ATPase [Psychrobacillus antarcticus]|uniref:Spaf_1101 family AAA-like ATPase n=1 Tax=Psychrobacillus antarcticus TaxID=2879115 RepID=UPI00240867F3|nr:AAA family ATPase [Psychrobacillus antarcticus]
MRLKKSAIGVMDVYSKIESMRKKYGKVKKAEIHFHTPASYDYKLISNDKYYNELSETEIIEFASTIGYLTVNQKEIILTMFLNGEYSGEEYEHILKIEGTPYEDFKERLSYELIAYKLYSENIELAIITDHNTISGFSKLKYALDQFYKKRIKYFNIQKSAIKLLLGVEISCSDCNHVVGIFDEENIKTVEDLLDSLIHSEKSGTVENTYTILNIIRENNGIGYIAHINTYNGLGTKLYKDKLFNPEICNILGITSFNGEGWKRKTSLEFEDSNVCYLYESDAHLLNEMGLKNTWIKMDKISFDALKIALKNYSFCVYHEKPTSTPIFIKGLYIKPTAKSFLTGKRPNENFIVDFSKDLNCIIGGRGTGKSTIFNILDTIFTQETDSLAKLKFTSLYEFIYVVFRANHKDYVIRFVPQTNEHLDITRNDFFSDSAFKIHPRQNSIIQLSKDWYDLFEISSPTQAIELKNILDCEEILSSVYKKHYSINHIVNLVQQRSLGDFIKKVIHSGITNSYLDKMFQRILKSSSKDFIKNLKIFITNLRPQLTLIENEAKQKIQGFNNSYKDLIQIEFAPQLSDTPTFVHEIFKSIKLEEYISKTKLKWIDALTFIEVLIEKVGYIDFLDMLIKRQFLNLNAIEPIKKYATEELTVRDLENGFINIEDVPLGKLYGPILDVFKNEQYSVIASLEAFIKSVDDFSINFNVNSKESIQTLKPEFRKIENLSLGQQVVAILTFIMEYGKYTGDFTPFIIDQPEDNLDNQYIYNTLVSSLRKIKNHRQVIIVTHNSTIVTNADAEQVIVLDSDGNTGYIKKAGYLSDSRIMRLILVHLEGGEKAFADKRATYSAILNKN